MTTKSDPLPSCCEYHGMEDGCCQGKLCPARRPLSDEELGTLGRKMMDGLKRLILAPLRPLLPARTAARRAPLPHAADNATS